MRTIKFIWDFRGEFALKTAEHHAIHLNEFCEKENLTIIKVGVETKSEFHTIAYITANESLVKVLRDALKPQRAEIV